MRNPPVCLQDPARDTICFARNRARRRVREFHHWHCQLQPPRLPNKAWLNPILRFRADDSLLLRDDENWIDARFWRAAFQARLARHFALTDRAWCRSRDYRYAAGTMSGSTSGGAAQRPSRNSPEQKAYAWVAA